MNISFITAFRKFKGDFDRVQQSCMYSWKANGISVIAPSNEVGIKEKCADWDNITIIDGVKRARELGFNNQCPIIGDMITRALPLIDTTMVGLINSDIIIEKDFAEKVQKIFDKYGYDIYLVGSRKDIDLHLTIHTPETYQQVLDLPRTPYDASTSSDIFITSKILWRQIAHKMPQFILGRYGWDNYLHFYAQVNQLKKFNCSEALPIIHCKHDYRHIRLQENADEKHAASSQHNLELWKGFEKVYGTPRIQHWPKVEI